MIDDVDRNYLRKTADFLIGNKDNDFTHVTGLHWIEKFEYPACIDEAVIDFRLPPFELSGGDMFAINFRNVRHMSEVIAMRNDTTGKPEVSWPNVNKYPFKDFRSEKIGCRPTQNGDTALIFRDNIILFVPFAVSVLEELKRSKVRTEPLRIPKPAGVDPRL